MLRTLYDSVPEWVVHGLLVVLIGAFVVAVLSTDNDRSLEHYMVGETLDKRVFPSDVFSSGGVVVFVSPTCIYCMQSMRFYRELGELVLGDMRTGRPSFIFATHTSFGSEDQLRVLGDNHVPHDSLLSIDVLDTGVRSVPTLLILNRDLNVERAWTGLLGEADEVDVVKFVGRMTDHIN